MKTKLRVVVFGPPLHNSGGVGTLFTYFRKQVQGQVDLRFVNTRGSSRKPLFSVFNLCAAVGLATILKFQGKIDVAHLNMGSRGSAFRKLTLTFWLKKILGIPTALHLHASSFDTWMDSSQPLLRKMVVKGINLSDKIFVLGHVWKKKLVDFGVDVHRIEILVMGVPDLSHQWAKRMNNDDTIRVLFAGEMSERKGLPNLLEAMSDSQLAQYRLSVAGSGSIEHWKEFVKSKPAEKRIKFLGHIPVDGVHEELSRTDILILPSRAEGLPVSVMEGFAARTTVICTVVGALEPYLKDSKNAIVLSSNSKTSIVEALLRASDKGIRLNLSKSGYETWINSFDVKSTSTTLMTLWEALGKD